jgi:hypothetical protein
VSLPSQCVAFPRFKNKHKVQRMIPVWFYRTLGVLLALGGCALVGINAYATWLQGSTWAVTDGGKIIAKFTAVTMEVVGVVLIGFAAGAAWSGGKRLASVALTIIMLVSGIHVVNSIASFRATERMSASKTREAAIDRVAAADQLQKDSAKEVLKFAGKNADDKGARRDFIGANEKAVKAFRDAPVEVRIDPDSGAELWAAAFGITVQRMQMWLSAMEAIWQVVLSMVCFHVAGLFLNPLSWLKASTDRKTTGNTDGGGVKKDNVVPLHKPEQATVVNAVPLSQPEVTTPAASASPLSPPQQTTAPLTVSSGPPVESHAPTQRRWTEDDVDALLSRVANDPKRPSWRAMGLMTGWDYAQLHKRWQRSTTGVNSAAHKALGKQRRQHRQQEYRGSYPN